MKSNLFWKNQVGIRLTEDLSGFVCIRRGWFFKTAKRFSIRLPMVQSLELVDRDDTRGAEPSEYRRPPGNPPD